MLTLKYPMPALVAEVMEISALPDEARRYPGRFRLFDCPLQDEPTLLNVYARELGRITTEIRRRLTTVTEMVCHPHRVGVRNCVSVTLSNDTGAEVNLLLLISGEVGFPDRLDTPRWVIEVTDSVDVVYLLLWLKACF